MPTKVLKQLNVKQLKRAQRLNAIDCPFSFLYDGPKRTMNWGFDAKCKKLCGKLFPRAYKSNCCPCWYMKKANIKKVFWKKLSKAQPAKPAQGSKGGKSNEI